MSRVLVVVAVVVAGVVSRGGEDPWRPRGGGRCGDVPNSEVDSRDMVGAGWMDLGLAGGAAAGGAGAGAVVAGIVVAGIVVVVVVAAVVVRVLLLLLFVCCCVDDCRRTVGDKSRSGSFTAHGRHHIQVFEKMTD